MSRKDLKHFTVFGSPLWKNVDPDMADAHIEEGEEESSKKNKTCESKYFCHQGENVMLIML